MARQSIAGFVRDCLCVSEKENLVGIQKCTGFALVHMQGNQQVELKTIKLGSRQWDPKEIGETLEGVAENFAAGIPGVQQFQVLAFYDGRERPQSFYPFRKSGESEGFGLATEPPTTTGLLQSLMRHNEANTRVVANLSVGILDKYEKLLDKALSRIDKLEEENFDTVELAKDLVMKQAADQHSNRMEEIKTRQSMEDRKVAMRLLPAIANRVLGKEIFPQAAADTAMFEHLAETLDKDQIQKLASVLRPDQWGLVADRLNEILKRKVAEEQSKGAAE